MVLHFYFISIDSSAGNVHETYLGISLKLYQHFDFIDDKIWIRLSIKSEVNFIKKYAVIGIRIGLLKTVLYYYGLLYEI